MSTLNPTRKERTNELLRTLGRGPSLGEGAANEAAERAVRLWLSTWVIPEVLNLVPELKNVETGLRYCTSDVQKPTTI